MSKGHSLIPPLPGFVREKENEMIYLLFVVPSQERNQQSKCHSDISARISINDLKENERNWSVKQNRRILSKSLISN